MLKDIRSAALAEGKWEQLNVGVKGRCWQRSKDRYTCFSTISKCTLNHIWVERGGKSLSELLNKGKMTWKWPSQADIRHQMYFSQTWHYFVGVGSKKMYFSKEKLSSLTQITLAKTLKMMVLSREYMRCKQALGLLILAFSDQIASFSLIIHVSHHITQVLCWPFHFSLKIWYNRDPLSEPWKFSDFSFLAQSQGPVGNHGRY